MYAQAKLKISTSLKREGDISPTSYIVFKGYSFDPMEVVGGNPFRSNFVKIFGTEEEIENLFEMLSKRTPVIMPVDRKELMSDAEREVYREAVLKKAKQDLYSHCDYEIIDKVITSKEHNDKLLAEAEAKAKAERRKQLEEELKSLGN